MLLDRTYLLLDLVRNVLFAFLWPVFAQVDEDLLLVADLRLGKFFDSTDQVVIVADLELGDQQVLDLRFDPLFLRYEDHAEREPLRELQLEAKLHLASF